MAGTTVRAARLDRKITSPQTPLPCGRGQGEGIGKSEVIFRSILPRSRNSANRTVRHSVGLRSHAEPSELTAGRPNRHCFGADVPINFRFQGRQKSVGVLPRPLRPPAALPVAQNSAHTRKREIGPRFPGPYSETRPPGHTRNSEFRVVPRQRLIPSTTQSARLASFIV